MFDRAAVEIQDLTVRELEEAREFKLSKEDYVALRRRLLNRAREAITKEISPQIEASLRVNAAFLDRVISAERDKLSKQIRLEVKEELHKDLLAKVEAEVGDKKHAEALVQLRNEKPTAECVSTLSAYLRDLESEARTLAETASGYGDESEAKMRLNRMLRRPAAAIGWIGIIPAVTWMMTHGYGLGSIALWGVLATILASSIWMTYGYVDVRDCAYSHSLANRKTSSGYLLIVDEAKRIRMSVLPNAQSTAEVYDAVRALSKRKSELDDKFFPATENVNKHREQVRSRILLEDLNPMDVLEAVDGERYRSEAKRTA